MTYLSIVVTARNDNHGGDMLRRMQIFVNGVIAQSRRHQLDIELVIVEWNPPCDKSTLAEALVWHTQDSPCTIRIIQVPPELHQTIRYAQSLPLFQMIGKNVGIRRAQGEFVLATNIDLLFSDALFEFLAARKLQAGTCYRADRYDISADIPLDATLDEQFEFCDRNLLYIYAKDGIHDLTQAPPDSAMPLPSVAVSEPAQDLAPTHVSPSSFARPILAKIRQAYQRLLPTSARDSVLRRLPQSTTQWLIANQLLTEAPPVPTAIAPAAAPPPPPDYPQLHVFACGDFTLMAKQDWLAVRGYTEWAMYSMHLDSILLYAAHYAGIEQVVLPDEMRTYHIDHSAGWTPQTEDTLNQHLAKVKVPQLSLAQLDAFIRVMEQTGKPLIVNPEDWGMANQSLPEILIYQANESSFAGSC
jgi:hypothetical protein